MQFYHNFTFSITVYQAITGNSQLVNLAVSEIFGHKDIEHKCVTSFFKDLFENRHKSDLVGNMNGRR